MYMLYTYYCKYSHENIHAEIKLPILTKHIMKYAIPSIFLFWRHVTPISQSALVVQDLRPHKIVDMLALAKISWKAWGEESLVCLYKNQVTSELFVQYFKLAQSVLSKVWRAKFVDDRDDDFFPQKNADLEADLKICH